MIARMSLAQERVALVTGSSRGLGAAIARRLAQDGLAVAVNGLHGDAQAFEVARTIRDDGGIGGGFSPDLTPQRAGVPPGAPGTHPPRPPQGRGLPAPPPHPAAPAAPA